jgi:hypothetical protein
MLKRKQQVVMLMVLTKLRAMKMKIKPTLPTMTKTPPTTMPMKHLGQTMLQELMTKTPPTPTPPPTMMKELQVTMKVKKKVKVTQTLMKALPAMTTYW